MNKQNMPIALVLGGVTNHIVLINKLKNRGFYVILIDYLKNPPASAAANEHLQISTFDIDAIRDVARERKVELIINCCIEHLNKEICKLAEELKLPHPYSYATALDISDKVRMKTKMRDGGICTTPFISVSSPDEIGEMMLNFPVFVKPAEGSGSNAVNMARTVEEVKSNVLKCLDRYPYSKVIIEEKARGQEYSVYCFPSDGRANVLMVVRRYTDNDSADHMTKCIATLGPALITDKAYECITETAEKIVKVFGLNNTPMFMQVMVNHDEVNVIEFAGRMAGGFSYRTIFENTGVDLFDATINAFMGIPNHINICKAEEYITVSTVYSKPCVLDKVTGYGELLDDGTLLDIMLPRLPGTQITGTTANGSRVAFLIHKDKTLKGLIKKIRKSFEKIDVLDADGNSVMIRDMYLTMEKL